MTNELKNALIAEQEDHIKTMERVKELQTELETRTSRFSKILDTLIASGNTAEREIKQLKEKVKELESK